ncbi:methyltransferase domain-containing protein, partial [bacterium]
DGIVETIMGYRKAKVLMVAAQLDCFTRLERPATAAQAARALRVDGRGAEILLDALVAMRLLDKAGGVYRNTALSREFLVRGRPRFMGENLRYQELIWDAWSDLEGAVRRGRPGRPLGHWLRREKGFVRDYIRGMDNIARAPARQIAGLLDLRAARSLLDVGGGPGTYARTLLRQNPRLKAAILDLPGTLRVAREFAAREPDLADRLVLRPGDYKKASFGTAAHDAVLMSHITHDEGPDVNRLLFRKAFRALRPGGTLVVHDFMVSDDRASPLFGALFSVHMLAYTARGRTYTAREYKEWLREAGFGRLVQRSVCRGAKNASEMIAAFKPE